MHLDWIFALNEQDAEKGMQVDGSVSNLHNCLKCIPSDCIKLQETSLIWDL